MISYIYYRLPILMVCPALSLQRQPILPGHSALMQAMAATIQTEKWIQTRHVTIHQIITSALSRTCWFLCFISCCERAGFCASSASFILCFISYNSQPTIPNSFKDDWRLGSASADTQRDRGNAAGSAR